MHDVSLEDKTNFKDDEIIDLSNIFKEGELPILIWALSLIVWLREAEMVEMVLQKGCVRRRFDWKDEIYWISHWNSIRKW